MSFPSFSRATVFLVGGIALICLLQTLAYRLFGPTPAAQPEHHRLSVDEARQFMANHPDVLLVDLRSPAEFAAGHTPQSINIPLYALPDRAKELPANRPVLLVDIFNARTYQGYRVLRRLRPDITDMHAVDGWLWGTRPGYKNAPPTDTE